MTIRSLTKSEKETIAASQQWNCQECHERLPSKYHIDHIIPLFKSGTDKISNLRALCPKCHKTKTREDFKTSERDEGDYGGGYNPVTGEKIPKGYTRDFITGELIRK